MLDIYLKIMFLVAILAIPLSIIGSLIYWNRMSTVPDSISHSSLMIIAFSLALSLNFYFAAFLFILVVSFIVSFSRNKLNITNDATSVFTSQISLSLSTIVVFMYASNSNNVSFFLTGSILSINMVDIAVACAVALVSFLYYILFFEKLVIIAVNADIAKAEGVNVALHDYLFLIAVSSLVVIGVKLVGILLVSGLLIIPAMSAKLINIKSMTRAVLYAYFLILIGGFVGVSLSFYYDLHTGPLMSISVISLSLLIYLAKIFLQKITA